LHPRVDCDVDFEAAAQPWIDAVAGELARSHATASLQGPVAAELRTWDIPQVPDRPVNNARLIGSMIYRTRLELFDAWYQRHGSDVGRSVAALRELMEGAVGDEAFVRLERALAAPPG
jgi:predicted aminopeptidase